MCSDTLNTTQASGTVVIIVYYGIIHCMSFVITSKELFLYLALKLEELTGDWRKLNSDEYYDIYIYMFFG
jgi:uncharacterized metal-binding protein